MEKTLLERLGSIAQQIEHATLSAITHNKDLNNLEEAEITAKKLDTAINRFSRELLEYLRLSAEPADEISSFSEIQLRGEDVLSELKVRIDKKREQSAEHPLRETNRSNTMMLSSKLPKLDLTQYDGNILQWHQFWDQFQSNIGCRNLTDVDKLLYLKSSLIGNARSAIDGLEVTNKNYTIAINTLRERFGKESQIIDAHYAALYRIEKADRSSDGVRKTLNEVERHLRVLNSLGEDINHNHLRFLITEKFPEDIIYEMKMMIKCDTINEMRNALETIITAREDASRMAQDNKTESYTTENLHVREITHRNTFRQNLGNSTKENQRRRQFQNRQLTENFKTQNNQNQNYMVQPSTSRNYNMKRPRENSVGNNDYGPERKRSKLSCIFCSGPHFNDKCQRIKTLADRKAKIRGRCFGCFSSNHQIGECRIKRLCVHCKQENHNRALCPKICSIKGEQTKLFHVNSGNSTVLQTAIVTVKGNSNPDTIKCRALLDTGSHRTYITQEIAKKLKLQVEEECRLSVFTFAAKKPKEFDSVIVKLRITTRTNEDKTLYANVVPNISDGIAYPDEILNKLKDKSSLADDGSLSSRVDMLIGNDYYASLTLKDKIELQDNLFLIESKLGWILSGKLEIKRVDDLSAVTYFQSDFQSVESKLTQPDLPLHVDNVKCLWELESIGICDSPKTNRDEEAVRHFNDTTKVIDNRYTVSWPWNEYPPSLPTNFGLAFGRLVNILKRLNTESLHTYDRTLKEQLGLGIIEEVPQNQAKIRVDTHPIHYLPHHGVCISGKPTRIVYDASAKTKTNKSLNECLHCGPMMLENLTGIFLRFRSHQIGVVADVEKAFLQLALHEEDKDVTRFLWLKDILKPASEENLLHLRFCRVPFGIISSPFLLNATIKHHLSHHINKTLKQISNDIYVDNLVTGVTTNQEAIALYKNCKKAFSDISMNIRAWSSNSKIFMNHILTEDTGENEEVKVLGLNWNLRRDTVQLILKPIPSVNTKRGVLKVIASIYDPCGYAVAHLLPAKLFLQELWTRKELKWDTPLPSELMRKWTTIVEELKEIQSITLPRCYFKNDNDQNSIQLHCFVDASMQAYSAVIYISKNKEVAFVIGKSRLVPIKDRENLKIPGLELLGALIGSRLIKYVNESFSNKFTQQFLWTDSQIVIDWYNSGKLLTPFVARRVEEIKKNKDLILRKVPTELNIADIATRPNCTKEDKEKWLAGPTFLRENQKSWPKTGRKDLSLLCGEGLLNEESTRRDKSTRPCKSIEQNVIEHDKSPEKDIWMTDESDEVSKLKQIQTEFFPQESKGVETDLSRNLGLFLDQNGLIRCRGRMKNAHWPFDKKYPILIPKNCEFTDKIIKQKHEDNYHVGVNHTLSLVRENYWIPQGRNYVQKILKKCSRCVKQEGGPYKLPPTPALPAERVNYSTPFTYTGLDYLGPLYVKADGKEEKRWVCLYTCLAIRAISLEVVKDLTAQECMFALRRFISSRGTPSVIISDNALQFKLSAEVLADNFCIKNKITWKFIPQLSPWHGGFYERLVGIVKNCLRRSLSKQLLTDSHLTTVMKEIEAVVNTRPLTIVGSHIEGILRPADFLTLGKCIVTEPSEQFPHYISSVTKQNLVGSWKRGQQILEEFKSMFANQYLPSLRERYQHSYKQGRVISKKEPKIGDIVQIKGESMNRENWKVGKIIALPVGADGLCRVAKVKVDSFEFTRSLAHLYPLEVEEDMPAVKQRLTTEGSPVMPPMRAISSKQAVSPASSQPSFTEQQFTEPATSSDVDTQLDDDMAPPEVETVNINEPAIPTINPEESNIEGRKSRVASQRARERIREWTRQLTDLF